MKFSVVAVLILCAASAFAEPYTIRVGAVLPFSGELAYVGQDIQEGITLALEEQSPSGPRIEFIWEDGKFQPKESVTAAQKLIATQNVDVIVSLCDTADVIAPVAEKSQVIQISIRWNPDVAAKHKYTFTFESTYPTYYRDMAALIKRQGFVNTVFIHEETQAGIRERAAFEKEAKAHGLNLLGVESFTTGEKDLRPVLTRLLRSEPEIVAYEGFPPATEIFLRQLRTLRPQMRHIGFYEVVTDMELIEGQPFVSQLGFLPEFSERFEKRFGHRFKIRAPHGYETVRLINWAYSTVGTTTKPGRPAVRDQLERLKDFDSVLGKLSVNSTRNIEHPNTFKVVRNGKLELYK
jgi:branched-chain amino acid transport system substrate-binding protein